ncbi:nucleotide sugar dehydrogenase [Paenibacillus polymyxa]|uniref:nucleotide sugar dehydrogenase n=1 Tax=Paenibacillus polymyxa TaxID=1406 RepID=UPI003217F7CC
MKELLIEKIKKKEANLAVIGMGYVGLPLAIAFSQSNFKVVGFDIVKEKVECINSGKSFFNHIKNSQLKDCTGTVFFNATTEFAKIEQMDVIILCLPTPLKNSSEPDLSYVITTLESIIPFLKIGQAIILESTTYPGTTEEELKTRIENHGFKIGTDFFLVYSPEREDPGNLDFSINSTPKIIGGTTVNCLEIGMALYESIIRKVIPLSSTKAAEFTKLLENIYRSVNIGLINEMKLIADKMNIDIWEVIEAASSKPFGFTPFYPGPGCGGHCIPIDPFYLTWKAKNFGISSKLIETSGEINALMPEWVTQKIIEGLKNKDQYIENSNILILGLAYKKNIGDLRESPSVKILKILQQKGANIFYSDPYISEYTIIRKQGCSLKSTEINVVNLKKMDCVLISTNHDIFDYDFILEHSNLIVDTRGVYRSNLIKVLKA